MPQQANYGYGKAACTCVLAGLQKQTKSYNLANLPVTQSNMSGCYWEDNNLIIHKCKNNHYLMISMGQLTYCIYIDNKGKQQAYKFLSSELTAEFNSVSSGEVRRT